MRIMIIGMGYHARRIYIPYFMRGVRGCSLVCGLDIFEQKNIIESYLAKNDYMLDIFFTNDLQQDIINKELDDLLLRMVNEHKIDSVIISTEPLMHYKYTKWCLEHNLNILIDKPITAEADISTDLEKALKIQRDYEELKKIYINKKDSGLIKAFSVVSQRRFHPAYIFAKNKIEEVFNRTNCPITSIQVSHSDGQWRFPSEIIDQNYHPYNQGYGKCCHSGYHSFDMVNWFIDSTSRGDKKIDNADVFTNFLRPCDFLAQLNFRDYRKLFNDFDVFNKYSEDDFNNICKDFGEIDAFSNVVFKRGDRIICLGSINLIHNGFSQRNWATVANRDLYKGNGRVRQESYFIEQGPFQSILLASFQSEEINPQNDGNLYDFGGEYHFDIHVFRNSRMFSDWCPHEKYNIQDLWTNIMGGYSRGHQEDARINCINDFIDSVNNGNDSRSDFISHQKSVYLLSAIHQSAIKRRNNSDPVINIKID